MKSDNVEKYIEAVERKVDSTQEKFFELDKKFTVAENKLSKLEKLLHEDHFTRLLDKEWEKRKVLLTNELEKKHAILNDTVDNTLKTLNERVHRFSNETKILRKETERLDVSSSKLNRKMKSNEKKLLKSIDNYILTPKKLMTK